MKRINAFTIMEVIVVMLLSAIVISMGYSVLRLIQHEFLISSGQSSNLTNVQQLKMALSTDFDRAKFVFFNPETSEITLKSDIRKAIVYRFLDASVIRISTRIDTFWSVASGFYLKKADSTSFLPLLLINSISFTIKTDEKKSLSMHFHKVYPAQVFIETINAR